MIKLTPEQINSVKAINGTNARKDALQNYVIKEWFKNPRGILTAFTSFGKSYCICKIIKILNKQKPDASICIIVPSLDLRDDFEKEITKFELQNVEVHVVNSFSMSLVNNDEDKYYDLLVCDELHTLSNEKSEYFSKIIPKLHYKYFFGVSATLEKEHVEYLSKHGLEIFFDIPLEDGYRTEVVPEYCIYNIPVEFDDDERRQYIALQKQYHQIVNLFSIVDAEKPIDAINACLGVASRMVMYRGRMDYPKNFAEEFAYILDRKPGVVIWKAKQWQLIVSQRRMLLNNCKNSIRMILKLALQFDEPTILVCASIAVADFVHKHLPNSLCLHSGYTAKQNRESKQKFTNGEVKYLLVVKGLKQGYNNNKVRLLIRQGFTSKALDLTQYLGRLLRPDVDNPDKFSILVNIYVDDFEWGYEKIESQQKKWLVSSLYKRSFVEWVRHTNEIVI